MSGRYTYILDFVANTQKFVSQVAQVGNSLARQGNSYAQVNDKIAKYRALLEQTRIADTRRIQVIAQKIAALEKEKSAFDRLFNAEKKQTASGASLMGSLRGIGIAAGVGFSAASVISFGKELVTLSGKAEGIERAFYRISDTDFLDKMKKATHGTVSELELMKNSIKANNFQIPLTSLAQLFEFAAARAQQTGDDVNYLVDSIILGIGRKSPLILDNLGISAVMLRDRLKGVSAEAADIGDIAKVVGNIASEELKKMGGYAENSATQIGNIATIWEDFKHSLSKNEGFKKAISSTLNEWQQFMTVMFSDISTAGEKWKMAFAGDTAAEKIYGQISQRIAEKQNEDLKRLKEWNNTTIPELKKILASEQKKLDYFNANEMLADAQKSESAIRTIQSAIEQKEAAEKKSTTTLTQLQQLQRNQVDTYGDISERLKEYNDLLAITPLRNEAQIIAIQNEISALEELKKQLDDLNKNKVTAPVNQTITTKSVTRVSVSTGDIDRMINSYKNVDLSDAGGFTKGISSNIKYLETQKNAIASNTLEFEKLQRISDESLQHLSEQLQQSSEEAKTIASAFGSGFEEIGSSIVDSLGYAQTGLEGFVAGMLKATTRVLSMLLANAIGNAIETGTISASFTGPGAVFTLPAFIAQSVASVMSAFAAIPKYAEGAIAYGPTLGVFGEYPGASVNPEVVAPLSKLQGMMQQSPVTLILQGNLEMDNRKLRVRLKETDYIESRVRK